MDFFHANTVLSFEKHNQLHNEGLNLVLNLVRGLKVNEVHHFITGYVYKTVVCSTRVKESMTQLPACSNRRQLDQLQCI